MLRRLMTRGTALVVCVSLATIVAPSILSSQASPPRSVAQPGAFLNSLSADAQRADSPEGDLSYARKLIGLVARHVSRDDFDQLVRRLASADQVARHDPRKYVPEAAVAAAFNRLMAAVPHNSATPFHTDPQMVHSMRGILAAASSPALASAKEHPTSCLPDEAVLLVYLLIFDNGRIVTVPPGQSLLSAENSALAESAADDAQIKLDDYLAAHSTGANMALFSRLLQDMGIKP